ncbi:MAG: response regulator [Patescibacteria group bacterium]
MKENKENNNNKQTVFLVDDDEFLLDMYALKFKASGFNVEIAYGAEEAMTQLRQGLVPDVLLLDVVMPKTSGFEFLEMLKKENLLGNSLIIVLSNLGQKNDVEKGKKLGADDYIVKASFTPTEVVEKVKALLENKNNK